MQIKIHLNLLPQKADASSKVASENSNAPIASIPWCPWKEPLVFSATEILTNAPQIIHVNVINNENPYNFVPFNMQNDKNE